MLIIWKEEGETPLEAMNRLLPSIEKKTYVGRLDPMASGLLLILTDEECLKAKDYFHLDKTYKYKILFGVGSDSYDSLGLIEEVDTSSIDITKLNLPVGEYVFEYPHFSSKTVAGKPLWEYKKEGLINSITIPSYKLKIFNHRILSNEQASGKKIAEEQIERVKKVKGDFRQAQIIKSWEEFKNKYGENNFTIMENEVCISGGGYVRNIAKFIGEKLNTKAIAKDIVRTKIGKWSNPSNKV